MVTKLECTMFIQLAMYPFSPLLHFELAGHMRHHSICSLFAREILRSVICIHLGQMLSLCSFHQRTIY